MSIKEVATTMTLQEFNNRFLEKISNSQKGCSENDSKMLCKRLYLQY